MPLLPGLQPFRSRDYALYWCGQAFSHSGTWIEVTATTWLLYELTSSPFLLGLAGIFRALPIVAFSLIGGTVADRVGHRGLLLFTQSASVVTSLVLGTLVVTGQIAFWHIYLVSMVNATLAAFDAPTRQALFPTLVPRTELQNATTLNSMIFRTSMLVGPALAGVLIAQVGIASPFFVNAVSYFAMIGALLVMRFPPPVVRARASIRSGTLGGLRYVMRSPILPLVLLLETCLSVFGQNQALVTIFARDVLGSGADGLGLLLSAIGAGAMVGMVVLVLVGDVRRKGGVMLAAGMLYVAALVGFAWSRSFALSVVLLGCVGFADATMGTMRNAIAQLVAEDEYRGRVMSLIVLVTRGISNVGQIQTGISVGVLGAPVAATLGALVYAVALAVVAIRSPHLRDFEASATFTLAPTVPAK